MPPRTSPVAFVKLHRVHATPQATRVEFNTLGMTWRGEGGDSDAKAAMAYRLALCWNVLEGISNAELTTGWLLELCQAVENGDLETARAVLHRLDEKIDRTAGRLHDCPTCLGIEPAVSDPEGKFEDDSTENVELCDEWGVLLPVLNG
jgi:hypothetical protein